MSEPSRRELNKARTRQALIDATQTLGNERGLANITAEDIAERAGVSRRTFFNYFAGIEAVIAAGLAEPLALIAAALRRRPPEEQPLDAIAAALRERPIPAEVLLGWMSTVPATSVRGTEVHLRVWQHHAEWLVEVLRERLGPGDELRARTLAAAVMAMFEIVHSAWLPTIADQTPTEAVDSLNRELLRALAYAGAGWQHPRPQP